MKKLISIALLICLVLSFASCSVNNSDYEATKNGDVVSDKGGSSNSSSKPGYDYGGSGDSMAPSVSPESPGSSEGGGMDDVFEDMPDASEPSDGTTEGGETTPPEQVVLPSGMITAGAWVDNDNYQMWLDLFSQGDDQTAQGKFFNYSTPNYSWGYNSLNRVKVNVKSGENVVAGATVIASDEQGNTLFSAVTDAQGNAYLFPEATSGSISIASGEGRATLEFTEEARDLSVDLTEYASKLNVIEIMLVVDVTGSMGDEISFLKSELADVINRISANDSDTVIKLALLFYRDTDDNVPFDYYDFTDVTIPEGLAKQQDSLNKQKATGGGDYPEAVDEALEMAVNQQWSTGATTKIIFHVLDAPAHTGEKYANKLVNATKIAAEKGIRICPIICSGAADSTEYIMREAAIYTGGTFIFVTDDSGIGGSHHDPELPNVTIELLNSLMVRLVKGYHTGDFGEAIYWKQDPNLSINQ